MCSSLASQSQLVWYGHVLGSCEDASEQAPCESSVFAHQLSLSRKVQSPRFSAQLSQDFKVDQPYISLFNAITGLGWEVDFALADMPKQWPENTLIILTFHDYPLSMVGMAREKELLKVLLMVIFPLL